MSVAPVPPHRIKSGLLCRLLPRVLLRPPKPGEGGGGRGGGGGGGGPWVHLWVGGGRHAAAAAPAATSAGAGQCAAWGTAEHSTCPDHSSAEARQQTANLRHIDSKSSTQEKEAHLHFTHCFSWSRIWLDREQVSSPPASRFRVFSLPSCTTAEKLHTGQGRCAAEVACDQGGHGEG